MADPARIDVAPDAIPDLTREPLLFPAKRAHTLQSLARADTGGMLTLGYATVQGGLPIMVLGECVGGVGVSGAAAAEDEQVAQAGIDALGS